MTTFTGITRPCGTFLARFTDQLYREQTPKPDATTRPVYSCAGGAYQRCWAQMGSPLLPMGLGNSFEKPDMVTAYAYSPRPANAKSMRCLPGFSSPAGMSSRSEP